MELISQAREYVRKTYGKEYDVEYLSAYKEVHFFLIYFKKAKDADYSGGTGVQRAIGIRGGLAAETLYSASVEEMYQSVEKMLK